MRRALLSLLLMSIAMSFLHTVAALQLSVPNGLLMKVEPWGDNSVRVRVGGKIYDNLIGAIKPPPGDTLVTTETASSVTSGNLGVSVDASTGLLTFRQLDTNAVLLRQLTPVTSRVSPLNAAYQALNVSFDSDPDEVIVGFGQRSQTQISLNNKEATPTIQLGQRKYFISIPFGYSSRGWGFLWNIPGNGIFDMKNSSLQWSADMAYQLDFWVTTSPSSATPIRGDGGVGLNPAAIMSQYADITGHAPLLPDHAARFWQSKCRYWSQQKLLEVAKGYHKRGLSTALGMLVIDFHSWVYFGDYSFNHHCWPQPEAMVNAVRSLSNGTTRILLSTYPYFDLRSNNTAAGIAKGYFAINASNGKQWPIVSNKMCAPVPGVNDKGACYLIDPFNPAARAWVWQQHQHYFDAGIESFWLDDTEPGGGTTEGENETLSICAPTSKTACNASQGGSQPYKASLTRAVPTSTAAPSGQTSGSRPSPTGSRVPAFRSLSCSHGQPGPVLCLHHA